jgi:hypothetical protein
LGERVKSIGELTHLLNGPVNCTIKVRHLSRLI